MHTFKNVPTLNLPFYICIYFVPRTSTLEHTCRNMPYLTKTFIIIIINI